MLSQCEHSFLILNLEQVIERGVYRATLIQFTRVLILTLLSLSSIWRLWLSLRSLLKICWINICFFVDLDDYWKNVCVWCDKGVFSFEIEDMIMFDKVSTIGFWESNFFRRSCSIVSILMSCFWGFHLRTSSVDWRIFVRWGSDSVCQPK